MAQPMRARACVCRWGGGDLEPDVPPWLARFRPACLYIGMMRIPQPKPVSTMAIAI